MSAPTDFMCIKCKVRKKYKTFNVLCLICMSDVQIAFQAHIKKHGPIFPQHKSEEQS